MIELNVGQGKDAGALSEPRTGIAFVKDLLVLSKAKVVSMLVFTGGVGEILSPSFRQHWLAGIAGLVGIALAGGAGGVINQLVEPTLDQHMRRTQRRPLVNGRITHRGAVLFAFILMVMAIVVLGLGTNWLTLVLTLTGTVGYGVVYTLYLKPATPWNIVWGGLAGALPPLIGWVAVSDQISVMPLLLVGLIFVWTPAHFWPLALCCREDYANACIPMLPVTHGVERTRLEIVRYAAATLVVGLLPAFVSGDLLYAVIAGVMGGWYLYMTIRLKNMVVGPEMDRYARRVFEVSISYLFVLFAGLVIGHFVQAGDMSWMKF